MSLDRLFLAKWPSVKFVKLKDVWGNGVRISVTESYMGVGSTTAGFPLTKFAW